MELSRHKKFFFIAHLILTLASFYWLVSDSWSGLGLMLFGGIEFIFSLILCKNKKWALIFSGSILILCATSFYRDNPFCYFNYLAFIILLAVQTVYSVFGAEKNRISAFFISLFEPFFHIANPFKWMGNAIKNKDSRIGKKLITAIVSIIVLIIVLALLSGADMVFSKGVENIFSGFFDIFRAEGIFRLYLSAFVTVYIFGSFYATNRTPAEKAETEEKPNILSGFSPLFLLFALIAVYCIFCAIQIKYLFLGATLPDGISHAEYAREGFFELLIVSAINLAVVLSSFAISRNSEKGKTLITSLCYTVLAITVFLLFCSFRRMQLYYLADGLTRMRTLVFIFLIFEFIGLIITFFYLAKPKFNIIYIYFMLMLSFWLSVNVISIDRLVAKNQIDMYLSGKRTDIYYVATLSDDAAPELVRILKSDDHTFHHTVKNYFNEIEKPSSWKSMNLSTLRALKIKKEAIG